MNIFLDEQRKRKASQSALWSAVQEAGVPFGFLRMKKEVPNELNLCAVSAAERVRDWKTILVQNDMSSTRSIYKN